MSMQYIVENRRRQLNQPQTQNVGIGTSVNGQPNYNIEMDTSGWWDQANQAWQNVQGLGGGGGGSSGNISVGGGGAPSAQATTQEVQDNQLMRHQLEGLLDWDSPLMDRARQQGINQAARRGLGNSSIAAGNAMGAAMDRAMPIAQFDASRYGSVADQNMAAQNQASLANASNAASLAAARMSANASLRGRQMANDHAMRQMMLGHQLGGLDDFRRHMLGMETREDTQSFQAGQSDIDRMIQQAQFGAQHGLARDQFGFSQDQFAHSMNMDYGNLALANRQLDSQNYANQFGNYFGAINAVYSNPNLKADQQTAAVEQIQAMYPGFASQAWASLPPGLISGYSVQQAQMMPPMPPMFGGGG